MVAKLTGVEKRVVGEVYSSSEGMDNLMVLCDEFGGRLAGTSENRAAAEFIKAKFEEYGFENPHLETFKFPGCEVISSELEIVDPIKKAIPCLTLPMTASGEAEAEVIYLNEGLDFEDLKDDIEGKIAMASTRQYLESSFKAGALGFVWMHPYPALGPPTGCVPTLTPTVSVRYEDGSLLNRLINRHGRARVRMATECRHFERESWNVCGEIPGNGGSEEFVLFGGHYDGHEIAQAAFDCGAGCMAVTEMGRILNRVRDHLDGSVRIVCFSAEEFGCWGSKDYARRHADELEEMRFTYQLDCCAGGGTQMVTLSLWPELEPFFHSLAEDLAMNVPIEQRLGPGDSRAFFELGIPTGSIIDHRRPGRLELLRTYRHTEYDTFDKIQSRSMREVVAIGAISGLRIVNAENWPEHRTLEEIARAKRTLKF